MSERIVIRWVGRGWTKETTVRALKWPLPDVLEEGGVRWRKVSESQVEPMEGLVRGVVYELVEDQ